MHYLNPAERQFINDGGNLWYVAEAASGDWEVVRLSAGRRATVAYPSASYARALDQLHTLVRPSSFRTKSAVHHTIPVFDHLAWC